MFRATQLARFLGISTQKLDRLMIRLELVPRVDGKLTAQEARALMAEHYRELGDKTLRAQAGNRTPWRGK